MSEPTYRRLPDLDLWERNYNVGQVSAIYRSIETFGFNGRLATHGDTVMAGNHTLLALRRMREAGVAFPGGRGLRLEEDGEWAVLVTPLDHLSRQQSEAFAITDNRTASLAEPDDAKLAALLQEIAEADDLLFQATGYDDDDLARLLAQTFEGHRDVDAEPQLDRADELQAKWQVQPGDLWTLGDHRLLCGDSTNPADVQRLMAGDYDHLLATVMNWVTVDGDDENDD